MKKLNKVFLTAQIREIDKYTIEHEPITSIELMERASRVWCEYFLKKFASASSVVVMTGCGNNGGDGYAIARMLKQQGKEVVVWQLKTGASVTPDCEVNALRWKEAGGEIFAVHFSEEFEVKTDAVIIDAIFGSGLNRKVTGIVAEVIRKLNSLNNIVVAVDIPSGLMGEDNSVNDRSAIVCADYTFTFQFPKLSFFLPENACYVGEWYVLDIGLHPVVMESVPTDWYYTTAEVVSDLMPRPGKFDHKGTNGCGLLIAGSYGMMGGAILAARSAICSGIGLLYCHIPQRGSDIVQIAVPEAVLDMDISSFCFSGEKSSREYDAVAVGPALGCAPETVSALKELLLRRKQKIIIDADALNILAGHPELLDYLHRGCLLTPHMKEFERLAGKSANDFDRLNKLSIFARRYNVYIILKGAYSVIATPEGQLYFNMSGNPGMAKGGCGDVLTGVLLALAANGMELLDLARIGVFAHGLSGDLLVREYGYRGVTSHKIAEQMGKAWKILENPENRNQN